MRAGGRCGVPSYEGNIKDANSAVRPKGVCDFKARGERDCGLQCLHQPGVTSCPSPEGAEKDALWEWRAGAGPKAPGSYLRS